MAKQRFGRIEIIEAKEKKGSYGRWRKEFCRRYGELLIRIQNNTYNSLVEALISKGEKITCLRKCTHCCFHYVAVSLAHGIVIVDYLYKTKDVLEQFVDNHEEWYSKGYSVSEGIDRTRIEALSSSMPMDRVIADTRALSIRYLDTNIQCPFLVDDLCLIYAVRPLSCSGHYSASPRDWCSSGSVHQPVIHHMIPRDEDLIEMIRLADPRLTLYELSLPTMIYRLLTEGSSSVMTELVKPGMSKESFLDQG